MINSIDFGLVLLVLAAAGAGILWKVLRISHGAPENRFGELGKRARGLILAVVGHERILKESPQGKHHLFLFAAFAVPLAFIVLVQIAFRMPLIIAGPLSLALDFLGLLGLYGTWRLFIRRYGEKPEQLDNKLEDLWVYLLLFSLFVTGFLVEASRVGAALNLWSLWSPVGLILSFPLQALPEGVSVFLVKFFWRLHMFIVFVTLLTIPFGKLSHILFGSANIFFRSLKPKGAFEPIDIENAEVYGVGQVEQFTWKQLLDLEACVRCGRCQDKCPAHNTGKTLSPKKVIQDLRAHLVEKSPALCRGKGDDFEKTMIDSGGVSQEDIWSCTTCRHCMETCPMMIEHVDKMVDMRRNLVLMEGVMPQELVTLNKNLENNFNPWGVGWSDRNDWMRRRGVNPRILTEEEEPHFDVLLWIGCAGSFDDRYQRVVASAVRLMEAAGVSFGVMGVQEKCCGDPARSSGNEYLYQTLAAENIAAMDGLGVKKIVTTCPHCLKTLDKEYPQFGGNYEVVHHSEFLLGLVKEGRLSPGKDFDAKVTLHDSCYLSRYAEIIDEPRETLGALEGLELVEMGKCREENFCCGAGGGRMWMEEEGTRMNNVRTEEALSTGAEVISTACPFCLTMLSDGVKAAKREEEVDVLDIAEILERSVS